MCLGNIFHAFIPVFPLRLDEGTKSETYIEALSMDFSDEFHQIISSLEVILIQQGSKREYKEFIVTKHSLN